jgi:hypothetical protein
MFKYLKPFFNPQTQNFSYRLPKELVIDKIEEVFKQRVSLLSSNDMEGSFLSKDIFKIDILSGFYSKGGKYSSRLIGEIIEYEKGITQIKTIAKPSLTLYIVFFFGVIFGLISFYKFIHTNSFHFLFWSILFLIGITSLSIGFSNAAIVSIRERYKMYIDKELKT